jgi:TP901 family phage tail tape measure protein
MSRGLGGVNRHLSQIGGAARRTAGAIAGGSALAATALTGVVSKGAEVEQTLVNAGSKFQEPIDRGTAAFRALGDAALGVSSNTEFSASEAAGAIDFMAKAGEDAKVTMASLGTFANLATVATTDLATAADIASDAIGPLGLATDDTTKKAAAYTRTADLMAKTTNMANLSFEELFGSVKRGASSFRAAGQDSEQFLASVAVLAGEGNKGTKAGMDLARAMSRVTDESTKAPKALRRLGVQVSKDGKIRDFLDIMTDLEAKLSEVSEVKKARALNKIFGAESKAAGVTILNNLEKARDFEDKLAKADGFTAELAAKGRSTALASIKTFWSKVEAIVIRVFNVIRDDVVKITNVMSEWAEANKEVFGAKVQAGIKFFKDNFDKIMDLGPRVLKVAAALFVMTKALAALEVTMGILAVTTALTGTALAAVSASVLALSAVLIAVVFHWEEVQEIMGTVWHFMKTSFLDTLNLVRLGWDSLTEGIAAGEPVWVAIGTALAIAGAALLAFNAPLTILIGGAAALVVAWDPVSEFFVDLWEQVSMAATRAMDGITDKIDNLKREFNELTGSTFFEVEARVNTTPGQVGPSVRGRKPQFVIERERREAEDRRQANADRFREFSRQLPPPVGGPPVVSSSSLEIQRSFAESIQRTSVDINVKDKGGNVESVEQKGGGGGLKVAHSGAF